LHKLFYGLTCTERFNSMSKDKKALNIHQNTVYKKDTNTFKKIETVDSSLDEFMDDFYQEHNALMKKLEDR
ncbi:hypothetical protein, partial [Lactobacillus helveticus]